MISTPTLAEAASLLETVLVDTVQILELGEPVTTGVTVSVPQLSVGGPVAALVQTTTLANAVESRTDSVYSVKVASGTDLQPGHAVRVLTCEREPDLVGKTFLIDKVSENGLALIRKGVSATFQTVNQEGKEGL